MDYNKLEKAVRGIEMPEETAQKIISECNKYEGSSFADVDFSQQVSGVETVKSSSVLRYTAIAASLVLVAGGVGLAAHLAGRPKDNRNHFEEVEIDSTDINAFTNSIEATGESTIIEIPEKYSETEKMYYSYIGEKMLPEYGLASLDEFTPLESAVVSLEREVPEQSFGIVSADISDYTGDGVPDMLTVIYDESETSYDWRIQLYCYDDRGVYMIDEYVDPYGKYCSFNETYFSLQKVSGRLVLHSDYTTIEGRTSDYTILGTSEKGFTEETAEIDIIFDNPEQITLYTENDGVIASDDCTNLHEFFYNEYTATKTTPEKISYQLIDFESLAQEGVPVRYTLSDKPMSDLTADECRLLDEFFSAAAEAYELVPVESRNSYSEPAMKFEAVRNGDISCYMYIYADDYVYIMIEDGTSGLYRYNGPDGYMSSPLRTKLETVLRNGNITDKAVFYPPFGNLYKMSSEPYNVTVLDEDGVIHKGEVSGKVLHHAFYGYNWTECEDVMTKTEPSEINVIRIEIPTVDGYDTVSVLNNGYVSWYSNSSDTVRNYQLDDTKPFEIIESNI